MIKKFIIKFIIAYLICIIIYPAMYGALAGFSMVMSSKNQFVKQLKEEAKNPQLAEQRRKAIKKLHENVKHKPLSEQEKLILNNKEMKNLINEVNWFLVACFSSGLAFLILGVIIGIFLRKWHYILFLILPSIYLVWWAPVLAYIKEGFITLIEGIIVIIVFQYGIHFIGISLGSRIGRKHKNLPDQTIIASS